MTGRISTFALATMACLAAAPVARAELPWLLDVSGELALELQGDPSRDPASELGSATQPSLELDLEAVLLPGLRLEAEAVFEPSTGFVRAGDGPQGDGDIAVEKLTLELEGSYGFARLGKLTPRFGMAWDAAPGSFGAEFAEDYEMAQRWAVEAGLELFPGLAGSHRLVASASVEDTSFLAGLPSRRLLDPEEEEEEDVAASRWAYAFTLEGEAPPSLRELRYHASFVQFAGAAGGGLRERGLALGLELPLFEAAGFELVGLLEQAWRFGIDGEAEDASITTLGLDLEAGRWRLGLGGGSRRVRGEESTHDLSLVTSVGYAFRSGPVLELAWRVGREDGRRAQFVGLVLRREFSW